MLPPASRGQPIPIRSTKTEKELRHRPRLLRSLLFPSPPAAARATPNGDSGSQGKVREGAGIAERQVPAPLPLASPTLPRLPQQNEGHHEGLRRTKTALPSPPLLSPRHRRSARALPPASCLPTIVPSSERSLRSPTKPTTVKHSTPTAAALRRLTRRDHPIGCRSRAAGAPPISAARTRLLEGLESFVTFKRRSGAVLVSPVLGWGAFTLCLSSAF